MPDSAYTDAPENTDVDAESTDESTDWLVEESLVEEVSIDGMCGVY